MTRGLTIAELIAVVAVIAVLFSLYFVLHGGRVCHGGHGGRTKDAYQVRGIGQSLAVWAQNNRDQFPLPSRLDLNDTTVAERGAEKDTTANLLSLLVFSGCTAPEMLVSPLETNAAIRVCETYEYDAPKRARDPAHALWDPGLSADFTAPGGGNVSYAHVLPSGARVNREAGKWSNTLVPLTPVVGNRGPLTTVAAGGGFVENPASNTLRFFGRSASWKGNVAFSDNHVDFLTRASLDLAAVANPKPRPDHLFFDEPEDTTGSNAFLGVFIKAGPDRKDFKSIWD